MVSKKLPIQQLSTCTVPRNFILLDCIERANQFTYVTYGLLDDTEEDPYNHVKMERWNGTMIYDDGTDLNIFELTFNCSLKFPEEPPIITFAQFSLEHPRIQKLCNSDGTISNAYLSKIEWNSKMGIGEYLTKVYERIQVV